MSLLGGCFCGICSCLCWCVHDVAFVGSTFPPPHPPTPLHHHTTYSPQTHHQVRVESYPDWIQLVAQFTINSLNSWQWAATSVYYLLGLWSRLVSSVPYLQGEKPALLWQFVPEIINTYISSRCVCVGVCVGVCVSVSVLWVVDIIIPSCNSISI